MPQSVHGHEVLNAVLALPHPISRAQLAAAMVAAHGAGARYHTCSAEGMAFEDLMAFLLQRGKISETPEGIVAHRDKMCEHG